MTSSFLKVKQLLFFASFVTVTSLIMMEIALRIYNFPFLQQTITPPTNSAYMQPDTQLGWIHKPGQYSFERYGDLQVVQFTFDQHGARVAPNFIEKPKKVVLIGCSFTEGFGLSDGDTVAAKLEELFDAVNFLNFGVSGYSTYQSAILLERILSAPTKPHLIIYGLIENHELRNVGDPDFRRQIAVRSSTKNNEMPYCIPSETDWECLPPQPIFYDFLVKSKSKLLQLIGYLPFLTPPNASPAQARQLTEKLILEMKQKSEEHGADFLVFIASASKEVSAHYLTFAANNNLSAIDCQHPDQENPELKIPEGTHPTKTVIDYWAHCLSKKINELL